jgi:hypothetical protein
LLSQNSTITHKARKDNIVALFSNIAGMGAMTWQGEEAIQRKLYGR